MAVPKKKRYKQIVRSRRSIKKVDLLKKQKINTSYFSNFNNRTSIISIPVIEQYRFDKDKGLKILVRTLDPKNFFCKNTCPVCHVTNSREIGLSCATMLYSTLGAQWVPFIPLWKTSWWHPKTIRSPWYHMRWDGINAWPLQKSYRRAYRPEWWMPKYQYNEHDKRIWRIYYHSLFMEAIVWGILERRKQYLNVWYRKPRDIYWGWDWLIKRSGHVKIDFINICRQIVYFFIIIIDDYILPQDLEEKVIKFINKFK